jgi:sulfur-carrier protein adenylyltransferase/sulfurtransferase
MEGGIRAWKGMVATGPPDVGIAYFPPGSTPSELSALAWLLENGTARFYQDVSSNLKDLEEIKIFQELAEAEERHKETLFQGYLSLSGKAEDPKFPGSAISHPGGTDYMEGGVEVKKAWEWAKGKKPEEVVEYSLSLEISSYDLHLKMEQRMKDPRAKRMFATIADEEKEHLHRLQNLFVRLMIPR